MRGKLGGMPVETGEGCTASVDMDVCITILDGTGWAVLLSVPVGLMDVGANGELAVIAGPTTGAAELDRDVDIAVPLVDGVATTPLVTGVATTLLEIGPDTVSVFVLEASVVDVPNAVLPVDPETEVRTPVETEVDAPNTKIEIPETEVEALETVLEDPKTEVKTPVETEVEIPETEIETPETEVEAPETVLEDPETKVTPPIALLLSEVVVAVTVEPVVEPVVVPVVIATDPLPVPVDDPGTPVLVVETDPEANAPEGDAVPDGDTPDGTPVVEVVPLRSDVMTEPLATLVEEDNTPLGVVVIETPTMTGELPLAIIPVELGDADADVKSDATLFARLEMTEFATETKLEISPEGVGSGTTPPVETGVAVTGAVPVEPESVSGPDTDAAVDTGRGVTPSDEAAVAVPDMVTLMPGTGMMPETALDTTLDRPDKIDKSVDTGIDGPSEIDTVDTATDWPVDNDTGDTVTGIGVDPLAPDKGRMPGSTLAAALERSEVTGTRMLEDTVSGTTPPVVTGVAGTSSETVERAAGIGIGSGTTLVSVDAPELGTVSVGELPVPVGKLEIETPSTLLTVTAVPVDNGATDVGVTVDNIEVNTPMSEVTPDTTELRGTGTTGTTSDFVEVDSATDEPVVAGAAGIDVVGLEPEISVPVERGTTVGTVPEGPKRVVLRAANADDRSEPTG